MKYKVGDIFVYLEDSEAVVGKIINTGSNLGRHIVVNYAFVVLADTFNPDAKGNKDFFQSDSKFEKHSFLISEIPPESKHKFIIICFKITERV